MRIYNGMWRTKLKNRIKSSRFLYGLYFYFGSAAVRLLRLFIVPRNDLVLFVCFGGKKYDDSPRAVYEWMLRDDECSGLHFVWAFEKPSQQDVPGAEKVRIDSFAYYVQALRAGCWVTNSGVERGLSFKPRSTFLLNTWHGTPIKKIGQDALNKKECYEIRSRYKENVMLAQGKYEADIFSRAFGIDRDKYAVVGLPRNDELSDRSDETYRTCRKKLGLPENKKVILYAPTFREFDRDKHLNITLAPPIDFAKWEASLGGEYLVLFRAHYEVARILNVSGVSDFVHDVSDYPRLNDLILASDLLISDYSSIFFDYAIQEKPMLCFAYDYEKYRDTRGMYFDLRTEIPGGIVTTEQELLNALTSLDYSENIAETVRFRDKFIDTYGDASHRTVEIIKSELRKRA